MKNVKGFVVLAVLAILMMSSAALATNVTFQVNMSVQITLGNFDPATDTVVVRGSFNGWAGNTHPLVAQGDGIYAGTFDIAPGDIEFKYVISPDGWESINNRTATVGNDPLVLPIVYFNDVTSAETADVEVLFRVNMQVQELTGTFDPAADWVVVRGSHPNIGSWGGATQLFEETTNPGIYSAWITFDDLTVGEALQYKFVILNNGDVNDASWESQSDNRVVTATGDEPDILPPPSGNGFGEIMPEVVYFSNIGPEDIITNDVSVVFQVDLRPLYGRLRDEGYIVDVQTSDTVRAPLTSINAAGFFNNWPWGNFAPEHNLNDAGTNGDLVANDTIWSRSIAFPAGSPRNLIYKYGANQLDVEAGFARNHEILIDDAQATFYIPAVCWGNQDTLYQEWQVECAVPVDENGVEIPAQYTLYQNYPNPFNPSTIINFAIPRQDVMTLRVFDLLGREVATLNLGRLSAGTHRVNFDGSNLSTGMYFYRLESPGFTATRKMLLMK